MAEDDVSGSKEGAAVNPHDASLHVDPKTLPSADQDFARMLGFGDEHPTPAATPASTPVAAARPAAETAREARTSDEPVRADEATEPAVPAREWDEIHPRPAILGRQSVLIERAERVFALPPSPPPAPDAEPGRHEVLAASGEDSPSLERLRERDAKIAELLASHRSLEDALANARRSAVAAEAESKPDADQAAADQAAIPSSPSIASATPDSEREKELEQLRRELDELLVERDRLGDALAVANAARAEAVARADRLEAAYRTARGPHGPVPEGERELRGEVIGLRRRLEESTSESRRLREALDASATELAIVRAQGDDRQQELELQRDQIEALERDRASQLERLDESLARQRELLGLVSRVQAENVELRSTQAALEETLEARDLEISAREEHLQVTRRGLAARDGQLVDAEERLEQERHRRELVEAELERARLAQNDLMDKLTRRDARIAALSITLARVEDAIGRTAAPASPRPIDVAEATMEAPGEPASSTSAVDAMAPAPTRAAPLPPPILARWRDAQVAAACGPEGGRSVAEFLARRLAAHVRATAASTVRVTSLGGARAEAELELVSAYRALGDGSIEVRVVDRTLEAARDRHAAIEAAGLSDAISVEVWASADRVFEAGADALLLVDAVGLEPSAVELVDRLASALSAEGIVLFADRLAGGPIALSQTTREKLAELWQVLPESWTRRPGFEAPPGPGDDGGTPSPTLDPVAVLLGRFRPTVTVGFGHVADLFLGPARGFALSEAGSAAETLLASIDAIDESRSILESLPPRHGVGVLVARRQAAGPEAAPIEAIGLAWPEPTR